MTETDMDDMQRRVLERQRQDCVHYEVTWRHVGKWRGHPDATAVTASNIADSADVGTWVVIKSVVK